MIQINNIGENTTHDSSFHVNRPNGHPVYLLLIIKTPAKFLIDDTWRIMPANTAVIFKPGQAHRYCVVNDCYINNWAHITSYQPLLGDHFPFGIPITLHSPNHYSDLFHMIYTEYYGASPHRNSNIHNLVTVLLNKISDESNISEYPDLYYALANLREQIYSYPDRDWCIPGMAKQLNISTGYLHSTYQHYFGTTCIKDVIQSRVQLATQLLSSSNKPLDEIAELCGYHHTEHFIRQFKSLIGVTPRKYKRTE